MAGDLTTSVIDAVFGPLVDPETVAKMSPSGPDLSTPGSSGPGRKKRLAAGTALVSTGAGAVLAGGELADRASEAYPKAKRVLNAGRLISLERLKPRTRAGIAAGALGGDVLATRELAENFRQVRGKKQPVGKYAPMPELTKGILKKMRSGIQPSHIGESIAGTAGSVVGQATKTPARKAGLAGAGAVGGVAHAERNRKEPKYLADSAPAPVSFGKDDSFTAKGEISKFDTDKRLVFGWANISEVGGSPVVDKQGDYIPVEHLEDAAHNYVLNTRVGGDMHRRTDDDRPHHVSDLVESVVFTDEKIAKMFPDQDTSHIPRGWWVGFKVWDDSAWELVKKGERTGFSIHGKGRRTPLDVDELMGY